MCYVRRMSDPEFPQEPALEECGAENVDRLMLEYFSPKSLYKLVIPKIGAPVKIPCDFPSVAGFCSKYNVPPSRLEPMVSEDIWELCHAKMEHILSVNGLNGNYDSGLTKFIKKNKHGYSDTFEQVVRHSVVMTEEDKKLLARSGLARLGDGGKLIDVSDSVRVE